MEVYKRKKAKRSNLGAKVQTDVPLIVANRSEESGAGGKLLKRTLLSVILLLVFDDCMNLIAQVADEIADKINGLAQLKAVLDEAKKVIEAQETGWLEFRQWVIFFINFFAYCVA